MACSPYTLARQNRRHHLRLLNRLRLRAETTQIIPRGRYSGRLLDNIKEYISQASASSLSRDNRTPHLVDCGSIWRLYCCQSIRLLVVSLCVAGPGGFAVERSGPVRAELPLDLDDGVYGL